MLDNIGISTCHCVVAATTSAHPSFYLAIRQKALPCHLLVNRVKDHCLNHGRALADAHWSLCLHVVASSCCVNTSCDMLWGSLHAVGFPSYNLSIGPCIPLEDIAKRPELVQGCTGVFRVRAEHFELVLLGLFWLLRV